jgi:hypothetical protein
MKRKKGFIYLLQSNLNIYKYGCTTLTPQKRCCRINCDNKSRGIFKILDFYKSNDIFRDEFLLKWSYWDVWIPNEFIEIIEWDINFHNEVIGVFTKQKEKKAHEIHTTS